MNSEKTSMSAPVHAVVMPLRCPFCDAKSSGQHRWRCGTTGPDENDEYETGMECDKTVFRDGFLRCHDLLVKLVDGSSPMPFRSDGVVIPIEVWQDVLREVESA
jgi:hypothetical protein